MTCAVARTLDRALTCGDLTTFSKWRGRSCWQSVSSFFRFAHLPRIWLPQCSMQRTSSLDSRRITSRSLWSRYASLYFNININQYTAVAQLNNKSKLQFYLTVVWRNDCPLREEYCSIPRQLQLWIEGICICRVSNLCIDTLIYLMKSDHGIICNSDTATPHCMTGEIFWIKWHELVPWKFSTAEVTSNQSPVTVTCEDLGCCY